MRYLLSSQHDNTNFISNFFSSIMLLRIVVGIILISISEGRSVPLVGSGKIFSLELSFYN